jgi:integrase
LARQAADIVVCDTPPATFAEAVALIVASGTVDTDRLRSFRRDVNWVQTRLPTARDGSPAAPLPCDPLLLKPILLTIIPGRHNISKKRWTNIRYQLTAIQRKTGWLKPRQAEVSLNTDAWRYGLSCVKTRFHISMFRRFAIFCESQNIFPSQVTQETLEAYLNHLKESDSRLNPESSIQAIRYAWNKLLKDRADWGGNPLPRKRNPNQIQDECLDIPDLFYADLDAYCDKLRNPGRFNRLIPRKVAEKTIQSRRSIYKLSAAVLVRQGTDPSQVTSLQTISTAPAIKIILNAYDDRNCHGGDWTYGAETTAFALKILAKQWANLSPAELAAAIEICDTVRAPVNSFPKKAAERLRQFDDKAIERRFWKLPQKLWELAAKLDKKGKLIRAAQTAKVALALAIAFDKPLRITNLTRLDLALDFERDHRGSIIGIRIEGERTTKKAPIIEGALSPYTQKILKEFITKYRPRLITVETNALFPGQKTHYLCTESLGRYITKTIKENIGITVNPHLIRSLVATVILDENPRDAPLAQRMLDHKTSKTVIKSYGLQRGRAVSSDYHKTLKRRLRRLNK